MPTRSELAAVVRARLVASGERIRDGWWSVLQCSIGAAAAWAVSMYVLGHEAPFFACVAAVICLGTRASQRLRRVAEVAVGVTLGVAVGDALVGQIGSGTWQIAAVVAIALLLALALDGGPLMTAQAGLQAVFVVALPRLPGGDVARWQDAMVGGAVALAVAALLPASPWKAAHRAARGALLDLAVVLRECAGALRDADPSQAAAALRRARATSPALASWGDALLTGRDITRLSPLRRASSYEWAEQSRLASGVDRATRNLRVLVRRVLFAVGEAEQLPDALPALLEDLADALVLLAEDVEGSQDRALRGLSELAGRLDPEQLSGGLSAAVVLGQLRSAVVDLLEAVGVAPDRARAALPPSS